MTSNMAKHSKKRGRSMLGKFKNLNLARSHSEKTTKMSAVMLGDNGFFWVVTMGRMERLLKDGYELA